VSIDIDLEKCCRGDADAWQAFVIRTAPLVNAAVRRTIRTQSLPGRGIDLDDLVQEVYIRLVKDNFRVLASFDPERASISTWITIVARSVSLDAVRRQHRETGELDGMPPAAVPVNDDVGIAWADLPLHLLSDRQTIVLQLLFVHQLTVPGAAEALNVNEQTIRSTKHKALERLRNAMFPDVDSADSVGRSTPVDP
jgi:RNA polymerase sigma-70 factor (ECF subfamily)